MTKLDMLESARRYGFDAIMYRTWFCHTPTRRGKPCGGLCGPRQDAVSGTGSPCRIASCMATGVSTSAAFERS
jgi:hypothetical protein